MSKPALGRGLSALLGGVPAPSKGTAPPARQGRTDTVAEPTSGEVQQVRHIAVERILPCRLQPRKNFSDVALQELADSIREKGIVQPLIVRPNGSEFELIAGERRLRAAQILNFAEVPVIVREADDRTVLELALIENLQRENLNPLEEALGYEQLIAQFGLTQEQVSGKVGKSRTVIANALRLLKLPEEVRTYIRDGLLSVGHAKVILSLNRGDEQKLAAEQVIKSGFSVRQTEEWVSNWQKGNKHSKPSTGRKNVAVSNDAQIAHVHERLLERFGTKVRLRYRQGKGAVEIPFFDDTDLERILQILGIELD